MTSTRLENGLLMLALAFFMVCASLTAFTETSVARDNARVLRLNCWDCSSQSQCEESDLGRTMCLDGCLLGGDYCMVE